MSRYSIIAETFDFKQRAVLNGTRGIRHGVTPGEDRGAYISIRAIDGVGQPVQNQASLSVRPTLVPVSMRAHPSPRARGRESVVCV